MRENEVRKALQEGRVAVGQVLREFTTRGMPLLLEAGNLDYVMIDMEHGGFGLDRVADMVLWFRATRVTPFVRVAKEFSQTIPNLLDQGTMGILVSNIESADEARAIVTEAKYPPMGHRGIALGGAHTDFRAFNGAEDMPFANHHVMVGVSIESPEGLEKVDEIAAVEGIDIITLAHSDLSNRMGIHMQFDHPRFKEAVRMVIEACKRHQKIGRIYPLNNAQIEEFYRLGFRMMMLPKGDITLYRDALKAETSRFQECLRKLQGSAQP